MNKYGLAVKSVPIVRPRADVCAHPPSMRRVVQRPDRANNASESYVEWTCPRSERARVDLNARTLAAARSAIWRQAWESTRIHYSTHLLINLVLASQCQWSHRVDGHHAVPGQ